MKKKAGMHMYVQKERERKEWKTADKQREEDSEMNKRYRVRD